MKVYVDNNRWWDGKYKKPRNFVVCKGKPFKKIEFLPITTHVF